MNKTIQQAELLYATQATVPERVYTTMYYY